MTVDTRKKWDWELNTGTKDWKRELSTLISYRHLLLSLVRRDFLLNFQQTILGPVWLLVQPVLTLIMYVFVFGKLIGIHTGNKLPPVLFYFSGIILWNFFNDSFGGTSKTFRDNIHLFSKVYFPRIIVPMALVTTHFARYCIQLLFLIILILYFSIFEQFTFKFTSLLFVFPLTVISVGIISLSIGLFFSVITAKYRDISNLIDLSIRLLFFITPVIYPLSFVREDLRWIINLNPLTPLFELSRLSLLGEGSVSLIHLMYSVIFMLVSFTASMILFKKQGNKLIDVI